MTEAHGHYETVGDVQEWVWDEGYDPRAPVPKGEFDPRDPVEAPPKPEPKAKAKAK